MPTVSIVRRNNRFPDSPKDAKATVNAHRGQSETATIQVGFFNGYTAPGETFPHDTCVNVVFTPDEFKQFADEVQNRRQWLGV